MTRYSLLVVSNAADGLEDEFNRWYSEQHLGDVLRVPGFCCAQRFMFNAGEPGSALHQWRYAAVYEFESDEPNLQFEELSRRAGTSEMPMSAGLDMGSVATALLIPITERRLAGA